MAYITKKGDKPNMRDVAGEESNPGKRGNPGLIEANRHPKIRSIQNRKT